MTVDYKKLLRDERSKEESDEMRLLYYKYKLGIMPTQKTEVNTYFNIMENNLHKVDTIIEEISCNSFEEYLKNVDKEDIIINKHIYT